MNDDKMTDETWTIEYHEGSNVYGGTKHATRTSLCLALSKIHDEFMRGCRIGYIKTDVELRVDGKLVWADRIDVDKDGSPTPWSQWERWLAHYESDKGAERCRRLDVDRDMKVAYYRALIGGDYESVRKCIEHTEAA